MQCTLQLGYKKCIPFHNRRNVYLLGNYQNNNFIGTFICTCLRLVSKIYLLIILKNGNSTASKNMYRSQYEYEFVCVDWRDVPRKKFYDYIYDYQPLIDEHNKQIQRTINLETFWPTKKIDFLFSQLLQQCIWLIFTVFT